jgi:FAD:protein FMN transferase
MCMFTFEAIGTQWEIEIHEPLGRRLQQRILERIHQFDTTYSRFRPDSLVSQVATAPHGGCFDFPDDSITLFDLYERLHTASGGAVDPLVGRDLELLGYDERQIAQMTVKYNCHRSYSPGLRKRSWDLRRQSSRVSPG